MRDGSHRDPDLPAPSDLAAPSGLPALTTPHVTLVVPALDEVDAVPAVADLADRVVASGVCERVVLVDGGSTDDTVAVARNLGLEVVCASDLAPGPPVLGKGDSLWRATDLPGDVLVCRDADVDGVDVDDIAALVRAVSAPGIALAKGAFDRLQYADGPPRPTSGRITEFVARPLLALRAPHLAHVVEPLSGQFAIRRDVARAVEFVTRYGVDVGLVLAVAAAHGADAIVSVDVGSLTHRSKQDVSLVPMAHDVAATILGLLDPSEPGSVDDLVDPDGGAAAGRELPCAGPQGRLVVRPPRGTTGAPSPTRR